MTVEYLVSKLAFIANVSDNLTTYYDEVDMNAAFSRLVMGIAVCTAALLAPVGASAQQKAVFGASDAIGSLYDRQNRMFVDLVNKRAAGKLQLTYIPGEQLGSDVQVIEQIMGGAVQFYGDDLSWYANWVKDFGILGWGFTFDGSPHMERFLESPIYGQMADELRVKNGIRILAAAPIQSRILFSIKPIKSANDLIGLKMRVPEIKTYLALWETLGTKPTRVAWGEVFLGLKTGLVEGAEGPVSAAYAAKFHEAAKNVVLTEHILTVAHLLVGEKFYQSLPADVRKVVDAAAVESVKWAQQQAAAETSELIAKMVKEGATATKIDTGPIRDKALAAVNSMESQGLWRKGLWADVQKLSK